MLDLMVSEQVFGVAYDLLVWSSMALTTAFCVALPTRAPQKATSPAPAPTPKSSRYP
jgi:hypothetical protein